MKPVRLIEPFRLVLDRLLAETRSNNIKQKQKNESTMARKRSILLRMEVKCQEKDGLKTELKQSICMQFELQGPAGSRGELKALYEKSKFYFEVPLPTVT